MEALFSSSCEYLQNHSVSPKSYLDSRGHVCVVQVERPNKTNSAAMGFPHSGGSNLNLIYKHCFLTNSLGT